jgi:hypothetical protein
VQQLEADAAAEEAAALVVEVVAPRRRRRARVARDLGRAVEAAAVAVEVELEEVRLGAAGATEREGDHDSAQQTGGIL